MSTPAVAQIQGRVVESSGAPVAGATVELIGHDSRVGLRLSDGNGGFSFDSAASRGATGLLVRRLGYGPVQRGLTVEDSVLTVVLMPLAAALPGVRIQASRQQCPNRDEPRARALWQAAAGGYASASQVTLAAAVRTGYATVDSASVGWAAAGDGYAHDTRSRAGGLWTRRVQREGYVWELPARHIYRDFGAWEYPPLDRTFAWHFADTVFAARHSLSLGIETTNDVELVFCPARRDADGLAGSLVLARTGEFLSARWTFVSPDRNHERAGGELFFAPADSMATVRRPLVPVAGLFWRRLGWGWYYQRWAEYDRWRVLPLEAMDAPAPEPGGAIRRP